MSTYLYRFILYPLLFILAHIYALFNKKIRKALHKRYSVLGEARQIVKRSSARPVLIHTASMGEFEHVKPLIKTLKKRYNRPVIITFFSPSGFEFINNHEDVDGFLYLPFDFTQTVKKFYSILEPQMVIIAKHDVWINQVLVARKMNIPVYLINASLGATSSRTGWLARRILKPAYESLTGIYAISKDDAQTFKQYFNRAEVKAIGDTKFDQVLIRKEQALKKQLLPQGWERDAFIIVLGSIWKEDAAKILNPLKKLMKKYPEIKTIAVPHDPSKEFVSMLSKELYDIGVRLYSNLQKDFTERILLVDRIGILADLYKYAHLAFVGGSFKQGIHNVMEAAVYGIPVLYGPTHQNASEAVRLCKTGGGFVFNTAEEFENYVERFLLNEAERKEAGQKTQQFALDNINATEKLIKEWMGTVNLIPGSK